ILLVSTSGFEVGRDSGPAGIIFKVFAEAGITDIPTSKILVIRASIIKHLPYPNHFTSVPSIERTIESRGPFEHTTHIRHIGYVPGIKGLVEGSSSGKHGTHTGNLG